jgi:hypothetical protein
MISFYGQGSPLWLAMVELLQRILNTKNLFLKIPRKDSGHSIINSRYLELARTSTYCAALTESRQVPRAEYCSERIWLPNMAVPSHPQTD